ncbi:hypothetical protein G7085_21125 [Tessaracoccus sp. HDW20]|uniref:hypothetical protein n=1 Tax=Tessaracoccus coleopterorum TaxID=2714950 RepID=UPI0018D36853|nr:hypothetical protein [Tessaracoccus coleopterorum]NHB86185.1 hypothetical protein [Tessaracoccus coleopterorum]
MNITWTGTATAQSSISHGSETRGLITMLRRETIIGPDQTPITIPLISGNAFRGRLRRVAEQQLADVLGYHGKLTLAAAAALRSGGSLVKTNAAPISGSRLADLRRLVPLIGIFGTAGAGRIIDGCLQVGKLIPTPQKPNTSPASHPPCPCMTSLRSRPTAESMTPTATVPTTLTTPRHSAAVPTRNLPHRHPLRRLAQPNLPTDLEIAFFTELLDSYSMTATIAGRSAIGHGRLLVDLTCTTPPQTSTGAQRSPPPRPKQSMRSTSCDQHD